VRARLYINTRTRRRRRRKDGRSADCRSPRIKKQQKQEIIKNNKARLRLLGCSSGGGNTSVYEGPQLLSFVYCVGQVCWRGGGGYRALESHSAFTCNRIIGLVGLKSNYPEIKLPLSSSV